MPNKRRTKTPKGTLRGKRQDLLAAYAAQLHVIDEKPLNLAEIGGRIGVDKATVSRLLKRARKDGILVYRLNLPRHEELEVQVRSRYNLIDACILPIFSPTTAAERRSFSRMLGQAAAQYMEKTGLIKSGIKISLGNGATVRETVLAITSGKFDNLKISQLLIETGSELYIDETSAGLVAILSTKCCSTSFGFAVQPLPHSLEEQAGAYHRDYQEYRDKMLRWAEVCDTAIVDIGAPDVSLARSFGRVCSTSNISEKDLYDVGVVGEICNRPFDAKGRDMFEAVKQKFPLLSRCTDGVDLDKLRQMIERGCRVVAVAGGGDKQEAVSFALENRLVTHIVTDVLTAEALVEWA